MPHPSDSELRLLRHLWREKRLSARELHEASVGETQWSYSTTRKTLDRMVDKGLVSTRPVHGVKTFAASQPKLQTMAGLIRDFARNVLDSDGPLPAAAFVGSRMIDEAEVEALEALLEQDETEDKE